jgi:DNA repair photolyase
MNAIYVPAGRAREYSPMALNLYNSCDHGCKYCFVNSIPGFKGRNTQEAKPIPRPGIIEAMRKEVLYLERKQILLSFTGDPYCKAEPECRITRDALLILNKCEFPVSILTKGGNRCLADVTIFKAFKKEIKIGATLTFDNEVDSLEWEPGAALPAERVDTLLFLHQLGIKTWASLEPVIDPAQSLELLEKTLGFVDHYKIGKWNHDTRANAIDWQAFLMQAIKILEAAGKSYYIKNDLAAACPGVIVKEGARQADLFAAK